MNQAHLRFLTLIFLLIAVSAVGQQIVVAPYLQHATPTSIHIMWETKEGGPCEVRWGMTREFSDTTRRVFSIVNNRPSQIHRAPLETLTPSTTYNYQVVTGTAESAVYHFTTPPDPSENKTFQMLAMSDMQRDNDRTRQFQSIVEEGVLPFLAKQNSEENMFADLGMVIIPGDLTVDGLEYTDWTNDFFGQSSKLLPYVPVYPVLGNHERNSDFYFN